MSTPTTGIDRQLTGSDFKTHFAYQTAYGVLNNPLELIPLRKSEGAIKVAPTYTQSPERPADREAVSQVQDTETIEASISSGVSLQSFQHFISALCGVQEVQTTITESTIGITGTGFSGDAGDFDSLAIGDWFFLESATNPLNNVPYLITAKTSTSLTTYPAPAATQVAGSPLTLKSFKTSTGETPTLLIMQDSCVDDSAVGGIRYRTVFNGFTNTATLTIGETGPLTYQSTVQFERRVDGNEAIAGQSYLPEPQDDVLSAVQNIKQFILNNTYATCKIKSMSFEFNNNNQTDQAAGCTQRMGLGQISLSGSIVARSPKSNPFQFRDIYENGSNIVGAGVILDFGGGKMAAIIMDKIKLTEHDQPTTSNTIASSSCTYNAEKGQYGKTLRIFRNFNS